MGIISVVGFLEMWSETSSVLKMDGQEHYVRGGKPGYFPALSRTDELKFPHPVPLNLWDPFGLISASKGLQVPVLDGLGIKPYAGEIMAPFTASDASLPYVTDMLKLVGTLGY